MEILKLQDAFLFTELIALVMLIPLYVIHTLLTVRKLKNSYADILSFHFGIIYFVFCVVSTCVIKWVCNRLIVKYVPLPSLLPFNVSVRPVTIDNYPIPEGYHRFNPSMLTVNNGEYHLISLRESTYSNCPHTIFKKNGRSTNRLHLALGSSRNGPFSFCSTFERKDVNKETTHQGFEDGRLFSLGKEVIKGKTVTHVGLTLASNHWMFATDFNLTVSKEGKCVLSDVKEPVPVYVENTSPKTKQKNWMFIPPISAATTPEKPLFVQWVNPLRVVSLDIETGLAKVVDESSFIPCLSRNLRGNTNLLRHPVDSHKLIGIIHMRFENSTIFRIPHYADAFIEIEEHGSKYIMSAMSDFFRFPYDEETQKTHHIHFPMSMEYKSRDRREIDIFMGDMDCTALAVTIKSSPSASKYLITSLKNLT